MESLRAPEHAKHVITSMPSLWLELSGNARWAPRSFSASSALLQHACKPSLAGVRSLVLLSGGLSALMRYAEARKPPLQANGRSRRWMGSGAQLGDPADE
eukprot:13782195-Alexandrium_andersonii.AAC.1